MGIAEKMSKRYEIYMNDNEERIVDDFCKEIKKERVSDLTLDEYSRFRFWKKETSKELRSFYKRFKKDTRDEDITFDKFCKFTWVNMDKIEHELPDELKSMADSMLNNFEFDIEAEA